MKRRFLLPGLLLVALLLAPAARAASSFYPLRPDDPAAVEVTAAAFGARADGRADDTAALQAAIDRVQETTRRGVVLVPSGRYRLTAALRVWSGIRLIGYGPERPVFVLGESTPGYQQGAGRYLVHFVSDRPSAPDEPVRDANPGTFYSAMSNIDLEIRPGNPAAVGVRAHFAQHCYLAHMEFRIGDGRAGVEEVGNLAEDLRFLGGEFGITMHKPSPSWPFVLLDATFEGQRRAAIETEEGGLTLVRVAVRDTPTAVLVRPDRCEELFVRDSRFERLSGPAVVFGEEKSARTQINLQNTVCADVPVLARFRESGRTIDAPAPLYRVREFSHGLQLPAPEAAPAVRTVVELDVLDRLPEPVPTDVATLPPMASWVNLRHLGARGDGVADDTAALREAIARHRTIFLPAGFYRVTDTIELRPDTVLIGLNPTTTRLLLADFTPAFQGVHGPTEPPASAVRPGVPRAWQIVPPFAGGGAPKPLLAAPPGGTNIVAGLGLDTGGVNNRAVALRWSAGARSLVSDVRFLGGHGTYDAQGRYLDLYNDQRTADPDPARRWDSQHPSLWVTDNGGGVFMNLWTPSPFASAGLAVTDTTTPGRVYALSSEHHVRTEVRLQRVAHWQFHGLQTEAERGESPLALPLDIADCEDLLFANSFFYRVDLPVPFSTAVRVARSRRVDFRGVHVYSPGKLSFDNTLVDATHGTEVRSREIAWLHVSGAPPAPRAAAPGLERVAGGFHNIDGLAVGPAGDVFFVDQAASRLHRWSEERGVELVTDAIPQPVALAVDAAGGLVVVARHGNVYAFPPGRSESTIAVLPPAENRGPVTGTVWLPANRWRDAHDWLEVVTRAEPLRYSSADGSVVLPAPASFPRLALPRGAWGAGTIDLTRAYQLSPAHPGAPFYVADEFGQTTWRFDVRADGRLDRPQRFAEEGEAGVAVDRAGRVYVCAGQVFIFDRQGRALGMIEVPERPSALGWGGRDGSTLYIAARTSLYRWRATPGGAPD